MALDVSGSPVQTEQARYVMDIQIATLCDFAADYGNGKMVINGTFDALRATKMPVVHPHCSLAMRICVLPEDSGDHRMTINIIDEDGNSVAVSYTHLTLPTTPYV